MAFVPSTPLHIDMKFIYKLYHPIVFSIAFKKFLRILSYILYRQSSCNINCCETAVKTEPSINLHYQHPVASNQVVVANVNVILVLHFLFVFIFSKLSTRNSVQGARPLSRWGVEGVITLLHPNYHPKPTGVGYGNALLNFT